VQVKIISDGTHGGTRVVNTETGEELEHVTDVEWDGGRPGGYATATITIAVSEAELVGEADIRRERVDDAPKNCGIA
jgi:hypothetical protein